MRKQLWGVVLGVLAMVFLLTDPAAANVCEQPIKHKLLFETSSPLGVPSQVLVATNADELKHILRGLDVELPDADVRISFHRTNILVVVGASRNDGCRETGFLCIQEGSEHGLAQAVIKEIN